MPKMIIPGVCSGYHPSIQHMGDCDICGNTYQAHREQNGIEEYLSRRSPEELIILKNLYKEAEVARLDQLDAKNDHIAAINGELHLRLMRNVEFFENIRGSSVESGKGGTSVKFGKGGTDVDFGEGGTDD